MPRELLYCPMRPLAHTTGIGVLDKGPVEDRFDDPAEGMVRDTVPVRRRADQARFRFADGEGCGRDRADRSASRVPVEASDVRLEAFPTPSRLRCAEQVLERNEPSEEVAVALHVDKAPEPPCCFSHPLSIAPTSSSAPAAYS